MRQSELPGGDAIDDVSAYPPVAPAVEGCIVGPQ